MAASFVTNYGHPENNGLSFASPKRTITQGIAAGFPQYLKGYFNEAFSTGTIIGVDECKLNVVPNINTSNRAYSTNINATGAVGSPIYIGWGPGENNCTLIGDVIHYTGSFGNLVSNNLVVFSTSMQAAIRMTGVNNTIVGKLANSASEVAFPLSQISASPLDSIFYNISYSVAGTALDSVKLTYLFLVKVKFKFAMIGGSNNETSFTYPTGATDQLKLDNLKSRMATVYGGSPDDYLVGCKYSDAPYTDFFIDPALNNYYLVPGSLPTKMSYDGKYIGARPEGSFIAFNSSNFTYINFDANGNIINQRIDATATSNIVDLLQIRTINKLDSLGQLAARNGNELNLVETILPNPLIYTDSLTLNRTYKVYNAQITVGATTYAVGDCFIAKGTSFLSGSDTYSPTGITAGTLLVDLGCYEVENNSVDYMGVTYTTGQRFQCYYDSASTFTGTGTIKRFMGGFVRLLSEFYGTTGITAGTTLRYMQTYEVVGGTSVAYNSVVYTPGQRFTALTTPTTFTSVGGATLSEWNIGYPKSLEMKVSKSDATLSTDIWVKMHLTDTPLVNVDINGKVTHGNLDSGFNRATAVPLSCRYWQCRLTVQSLNIPY